MSVRQPTSGSAFDQTDEGRQNPDAESNEDGRFDSDVARDISQTCPIDVVEGVSGLRFPISDQFTNDSLNTFRPPNIMHHQDATIGEVRQPGLDVGAAPFVGMVPVQE